MSKMNVEKERRCLTCKKLLLDEKFPVCLRCRLQGRNGAGNVGKIIGGIALVISGTKAAIKQTKTDNADDEEE